MSVNSEVLVTGASGQLGTELKRCAWPESWSIAAVDRNMLNLTDTVAIASMVTSRPSAAVINGAAYTEVDKAESDVVPPGRLMPWSRQSLPKPVQRQIFR